MYIENKRVDWTESFIERGGSGSDSSKIKENFRYFFFKLKKESFVDKKGRSALENSYF